MPFKPKVCPATDRVTTALERLKVRFPAIDVDQFLVQLDGAINIVPVKAAT